MDNVVVITRNIEWKKSLDFYSKGSFFDADGKSLKDDQIKNTICSLESHEATKSYLKSIDGSFALIIESESHIYLVVDFVASTALYYTYQNSVLYISDDIHEILSRCECKVDSNRFEELFTLGYILGEETLCSGIKRIGANTIAIFDKTHATISTEDVLPFENRIKHDFVESELFNRLEVIFDEVFRKLVDSLEEKHVVLPLSGGFDSRLIACQLKKFNVKNVTCYTYGNLENSEVKTARMVAEKLGFNWQFIEYSETKWQDFLSDMLTIDYLRFAGQLNTIPHIQDYPAVKYLRDNDLIPSNSVFIPGHSGDMLGGSKIPIEILESGTKNFTSKRFTKLLLRHNFNFGFASRKTKAHLKKTLSEGRIVIPEGNDEDKVIRAFDIWNFSERQQKYIINSVKVFEFFGYEWRLPLWDRELSEFWYGLPSHYKKHNKLYNEFVNSRILSQYDLTKKPKVIKEQSGIKLMIKRLVRFFKDILSASGIIRRVKFFLPFEREVKKELGYYKKKRLYDRFLMASFTVYYDRVISKL